ncbi:TPA: UDP-N-acetylenolpyruvoylglucosamine reductase [Patescibacteria group bacterium]|nr:UDP-N-acetylenolpyruvoylglucosamine reductase [Patescibacteria group bacterium]
MKLSKNKSLKKLNTFMVDAYSNQYIEVDSVKDLKEIFDKKVFNEDFLILGGGSNILFVNDFKGIVIHPNLLGKGIVEENKKTVTIKIGAGENWEKFVEWSVHQNYLGLQNLANIPGDCGATPVQNIGAYGVEVKNFITSVEYFNTKTGEIKEITNKECKFRYRNSIFKHDLKNNALITAITFKLEKWEKDKAIPEKYLQYKGITDYLEKNYSKPYTIKKVYDSICNIRDEKLPKVGKYGSCGSTFTNPLISEVEYKRLLEKYPELPNYTTENEGVVKIPTAYILDKLGWKNKRVGKCGTWIKHPLIVTNYENATGEEIYNLIQIIQKDFFDNTGIRLNTEINIIF